MEKESTTIEIKKDVYNRLKEEREDEKEPFNSVLRRLLEMNNPIDKLPKNKLPNRFTAKITAEKFRNDLTANQPFMDSLELDDDEKMELLAGDLNITKTINDVEVEISITAMLEINLEEKSQEKLMANLKKIRDIIEPVVGKFDVEESLQIDAWYCYSPKKDTEAAEE